MGPFVVTGLATVAQVLHLTLWFAGLGVTALLLAVVVPTLSRTRADRVARRVSIPAYYRLTPAH